MNWLAGFKKVTHVIAVAGTVTVAWAMSEQGQQIIGGIIRAYPKLSGLTAVTAFLAVLTHSPRQ